MRVLLLSMAALGGLLAVVSCAERIGFNQPVPKPVVDSMTVRITPVWNSAARPAHLTALIYTQDGAFVQEVGLPVEGGELTLVKDHYRVIIYNSDLESISVMGKERHEDATARTQWGAKSENYSIPNPGMLYRMIGEILPLKPDLQSQMYNLSTKVKIRLKVADSYGVQEEAMSVSLRNIADALNLSTGQAFHSLSNEVNRSDLVYFGQSNGLYSFEGTAFGCCTWEQCPHVAENRVFADIEIKLPNGEIRTLSADITEAMYDVQINVTEIEISITVEDLGLRAVVTGWTTGTASGGIKGDEK